MDGPPARTTLTSPSEDSHAYLRRASFWVALENVARGLEPALVLACLRVFGGGEWGAFKVYEAVVLVGVRLACLGLERGLIWYQAQCTDAEHFRAFWRSLVFVGLLACIIVTASIGVGVLGYPLLPDPARYGYPALAQSAFAAALVLQALVYPATQFLVARGVLHVNVLARFVVLPLGVYGGALLLRGAGVGSMALPAACLAGSGLSAATALAGLFRHVPGIAAAFTPRPLPPWTLLRFSATIASSEIAMTLAARLDIYLLTTHFGLKAVEAYTTLQMMVNALRAIRQSFDNIVLGLFSRLARAADARTSLPRAYQQTNARVAHLQWPVLVVLLAYGGQMMAWLLPQSGDLRVALASGLTIAFLTTPFALCVLWQVGSGRSWMMPLGQAVFVAVNGGLNLLLIPRFGVTGGVVAGGLAQWAGSLPAWVACVSGRGRLLYDAGFWRPLLPTLVWPAWFALHLAAGAWWDLLVLIAMAPIWFFAGRREGAGRA